MTAPKTKLLLWSIIFILSVSCVPALATPTPVPPLDANSINLIIAQTADAASIQTMAAVPPSTATATFTLTPRNTFTPEPTFTPVPTFLFPTSTPILRLQYYRLKHDNQLAMFEYRSRTYDSEAHRDQTPEIVPMYLLPKQTSGTGRTTVDGGWEVFIDQLNNNDRGKLAYLKGTENALFNTAGFPQLESLTMGGNIITLDEIQGEWGRVNTLNYGSPPNAETVNYVTRPDLVHKYVIVTWKKSLKATILVNTPKGNIYYPLVSRRPVWVQLDRLESFPVLPMEVTAATDLYFQRTPGPNVEKSGAQFLSGQSATVIEYYPSGSNVWGRLRNGRWIPLLLYPQYTTSWRMETIPPPP